MSELEVVAIGDADAVFPRQHPVVAAAVRLRGISAVQPRSPLVDSASSHP
jgi:hypothetical protein